MRPAHHDGATSVILVERLGRVEDPDGEGQQAENHELALELLERAEVCMSQNTFSGRLWRSSSFGSTFEL